MKSILLSSSSTFDGVKNQIKSYYFGTEKLIQKVSENEWSIAGKSGVHCNVRIIKVRKRYRFEMIS